LAIVGSGYGKNKGSRVRENMIWVMLRWAWEEMRRGMVVLRQHGPK